MYKAFGELRSTPSALGTDYKFTGQREEASLGLYFFVARWFDPSLGRFTSPDTIVPTSTQGTQAWDRYAFVNNNPVRYNDPTGHWMTSEGRGGSSGNGGCSGASCAGITTCKDPEATNYGAPGTCTYPAKPQNEDGGRGGKKVVASPNANDNPCSGRASWTGIKGEGVEYCIEGNKEYLIFDGSVIVIDLSEIGNDAVLQALVDEFEKQALLNFIGVAARDIAIIGAILSLAGFIASLGAEPFSLPATLVAGTMFVFSVFMLGMANWDVNDSYDKANWIRVEIWQHQNLKE